MPALTPILPTIIAGPAVLQWNAFSYYSEQGFKLDYKRETFDIQSSMHGKIDTRLKSDMVTISWQPDGQLINISKMFPYAPSHIGGSIFGIASGGDTVIIHTKAGIKYTWQRGALTKFPKLRLNPTMTLFGDMEMTCIGKAATQRTAADFWKTVTSAAFADITYDETKIYTNIFKAAYGSSPYDAIGSIGGFEIDIVCETKPIPAVDVGIANIHLRSLVGTARFAPSNLTEAQVDTLMAMQDATALQIGQSVAKSDTDLVIASDTFSATLHKAGPVGYGMLYEASEHQHQGIEFASKRTFTTGVANALWTFTIL